MDPENYLTRIGMHGHKSPSLAYLTTLQRQHLLHVPFENLSVIRQEPIVLDVELLYEKVVARGRGGFCFELNGAFGWLLDQLGFHVIRVAAGVYHAGRQEYGPTFDHMALIVMIEDVRYLVDVGFGDSARTPIALPDGQVQDVSGAYRLCAADGGDRCFYLQKADATQVWQPRYRFTDRPRQMADYGERCAFLATSVDSHFTQGLICTIATPDGRISLSSDSLTITRHGHAEKRVIDANTSVDGYLREYFGQNFA